MAADWPAYILAASGLAWVYLGFFRSFFWRINQTLPQTAGEVKTWPAVTAIIPARNEAEVLGHALPSVAGQTYPGKFNIILVNDSSTDDTAEIARAIKGVEVLNAKPLEPGWAGKLWAMNQGVGLALKKFPKTEFFWFTDADIVHGKGVLEGLVRAAVLDRRAMVSQMVFLHCRSYWEKAFVPAFIFFFAMLYPFPAINRTTSKTSGAAGGCILVAKSALLKIGGIERIKNALIDDCALAAAVKGEGEKIWLGLGIKSHSIRAYSFSDFWTTVARTAFTQLQNSSLLLAGTLLAMAVVFLVPPVFALGGLVMGDFELAKPAIFIWGAMIVFYAPALMLYGLHPVRGYNLPFVALLYMAMTFHSAIRHWFGRGGQWKERSYDFGKRK